MGRGSDKLPGADFGAYPRDGTLAERMRYLLRYAVLAPSAWNTQPWQFRVEANGHVEFRLDPARSLADVDPDGRLARMAVGASLKLFLLAAEAHGLDCETHVLPDVTDELCIARVVPRPDGYTSPMGEELLPFAEKRRHGWGEFARGEVADSIRARIRGTLDGMAEIRFEFVTDLIARQELAEIVAEANRSLYASRTAREAIAQWYRRRPHRNGSADGLPMEALDLGWLPTPNTLGRRALLGSAIAERERMHVLHAPLVLVLGTAAEDPSLLPAVGGARLVAELVATEHYLSCAAVDAPLLLPGMRQQVQNSLYDESIVPQAILRFGFAPPLARVPHRTLSDGVLLA